MKISKKEIRMTGRLLQTIGDALIENPNLLMEFFDSKKDSCSCQNKNEGLKINLFQKYKISEDHDLSNYLASFSVDQLLDIMRFNHIYTTKYKRKSDIIKYIIHIVSMQNLDIFINQIHDQTLINRFKRHTLEFDD